MIEFFRPRRRRNKFRLDGSETFVDYTPTKLEYTDVLLLLVDFADKNVDSLHIGFIRRLRIVCRLDKDWILVYARLDSTSNFGLISLDRIFGTL